jgi:O-antigen/teichoic acid export membrane protein
MSDLGYFAVVVKMTEFVNFIPGVLVVSLFPALILSKKNSHALYKDRFLKLYDLLLALGVVFSIGLFLFAEPFIVLLYGEGYRAASKILVLYSWTIIPFFINIALNNYFIIEHKTNIYLGFSVVVGIISIFLNFWLITWAGLFGAALATFIVYWLNFVLLFMLKDTREHAFIILRALFLPKTFFRLLSYVGIK